MKVFYEQKSGPGFKKKEKAFPFKAFMPPMQEELVRSYLTSFFQSSGLPVDKFCFLFKQTIHLISFLITT